MNYKNNLRRVKNFAKKKIKLLANYPDLKGEISNLKKLLSDIEADKGIKIESVGKGYTKEYMDKLFTWAHKKNMLLNKNGK